MKKKIISVLLAALLLPSCPVSADKGGAVEYLTAERILIGDENGQLNPDSYVTRAEFAKLAAGAFGLDIDGGEELSFSDLKKDHWAYKYLQAACRFGLMEGFEDGTIRPDENITYEQAIKMATIREYDYYSYPQGYISNAIDRQCLDNVNCLIGESMTREDTANLIYNVLMSMKNGLLSAEFADRDEDKSNITEAMQSNILLGSSLPRDAAAGGSGSALVQESAETDGMTYDLEYAAEAPLTVGGTGSMSKMAAPGYSAYVNDFSNTESYAATEENIWHSASVSPLSTFSIDTDTASYSNMRRFIFEGSLPANGSVRSEELINYFDYELPEPEDGEPFSVTTELGVCPWDESHSLAMIGIQGEEITLEDRQPQNLVFLIDVSGSMYSYNKLPLLKRSLKLLLDSLDERDRISVVTYASGSEVLLSGVPASERERIEKCIDSLAAEGSTNGEGGIKLAYEQAEKYKSEGNNRIILCTDGDFNVGVSSNADLKELIVSNRDKNIFLSILGFGTGNYKDDKLEIMADNGNGSYYYIDNFREAHKVLAAELTQTLYTIAKDVKIQVEFNPAKVREYRLIGYENRVMSSEDFENDEKDAGELGSGASVVALYELVTEDSDAPPEGDSSLRYQNAVYLQSDELMDVKLRYKLPKGTESILKEYPVESESAAKETSDNFRFAASVAELGMILNDSSYKGSSDYGSVISLARGARGDDRYGFRTEFVQMADLLRYIRKH